MSGLDAEIAARQRTAAVLCIRPGEHERPKSKKPAQCILSGLF
jgi:hypothetical protein